MAISATDVFLSYKAEDRPRLIPLVESLEAEGFTVWWDAHIGGGTNWRQEIQEHLEAAKCVIVAWSNRSVGADGEFVRDEAMRAKRHRTYLPICIDDVEPPLGFGEVQALSLVNWRGERSDPRIEAIVDAVRGRLMGEHATRREVRATKPKVSRRAVVAGAVGVGTAAVAGLGGWLLLKPGAANAKRIAVLPFANLSGAAEQTYFADGIAEELRAALSRIGMEVIGRSSSISVKDLDAQTAAEKLAVAHILTGSVRRTPDVIRVSAQLVSGKDGVERWAQSYDRAPGDAIKIQTDIAANVVQALDIVLGQTGRVALTLGGTADSVAQDLLLQARQLRRSSTGVVGIRRCLALVETAIGRDPNYALAHAEKATLLIILAMNYSIDAKQVAERIDLADRAANRAVAIAPALGLAHLALFGVEQSRLNFSLALQHFQRAAALSPDEPDVLFFGPGVLAQLGKVQEAMRLADRLITLDPLNHQGYQVKASVLFVTGQYPQAIEVTRKALQMRPEATDLNATIGLSYLVMNRPKEAQAAFRLVSEDNPLHLMCEALLAARTGDVAGAERWASEFRKQYGYNFYPQAHIRAQLGDKEGAFAELNKALAIRDNSLLGLKTDPFLDPIRDDPRFAALVRKLQFPS